MIDANAPTAKRKIAAADRQARAVKARIEGKTYQEIGNELGISKQAAYQSVKVWLEKTHKETHEDAELLKGIEKRRLEEMITIATKMAKQNNVKAIEAVRKLSESLRKLQGLDAPSKVEIPGDTIEFVIRQANIPNSLPPKPTDGK